MPDSTEIIHKDGIRRLAESQDEQNSYFRQAFRSLDGSDAGGSMSFPQITEEDEVKEVDIEEIPEGAEYPQAEFDYSAQTLYFSKYGVALTFTDEAVDDSRLNVVMDGQQNLLTAESKRMDSLAYNVLAGAAQNSGQGNGDDELTFDEVIDARAWMKTEPGGRNRPDLCFVEPLGAASLLKQMSNRETTSGDEAVRAGEIGQIAGLSIIEADTGHLPAHNAVLVDSTNFGFEATKHEKEVERVREALKDKTIMKVSDRLGWIATDAKQAAMVEG